MDITKISRSMAMDITKISAASIFETYTTLTAIITLIRQFNNQFVPSLVRDYFNSKFTQWFRKSCRKNSFTLLIEEYVRDHFHPEANPLFQACQLYLSNKLRLKATRLKGYRTTTNEHNKLAFQLAHGERFVETLKDGIQLEWNFRCKNSKGEDVDFSAGQSSRYFELTFDFTHKEEVLEGYISSVLLKYYDQVMETKKEIYLYSCQGIDSWKAVKFDHPFTFDSLALDPDLKQSIIDDLDMFIRRKEFYKKVGKAWKRGYLLYGPPGTGKSSLVAAMANYLRFSIYDLQLGSVSSDANLRKLMLSTTNKSILVIEDIDCTIGLSRAPPTPVARDDYDEEERQDEYGDDYSNKGGEYKDNRKGNAHKDSQLSLSGLLNFIDGLWSSCGDERIIIFTTNHKERLDPAMLRPGRMDMHIHMSYLTMKGFRVLANNYLGVSGEHPLFPEIETLLETASATPAQIAEELIRNEDPHIALASVVDMLKKKCKQCQKSKKVTNKRSIDSIEGKKDDENDKVVVDKMQKKKSRQSHKIKKGSKKRRLV